MYDEFAEEQLRRLPEWSDMDWKECRRRLSRLFFAMVQLQLNGPDLEQSQEAVEKACDYLRRLANAIEQLLFSESAIDDGEDLRRARSYAFIAAEALDLWCNYTKVAWPDRSESGAITYARIESALLYLASDYQVNAHCSVAEIKENERLSVDTHDHDYRDRDIIFYLQNVIIALVTGDLEDIPKTPDLDSIYMI